MTTSPTPKQMFWAYVRTFPAWLMIKFTGAPRYLPDLKWSDESIAYNVFRLYELIFWRRYGIRKECESWKDENGNSIQVSYTYENAIVRREYALRAWFAKWKKILSSVRITVPVLVTPTGQRFFASPYVFAIAFDSATGFTTSYSNTLAHTVSGSDPFLFSQDSGDGGTKPNPWNATWDTTQNMLNITSIDCDGNGSDRWSRIRTLGNPNTGTHNIVSSGSSFDRLGALSYSGAQQTDTPDGSNFSISGAGAGNQTVTITVTASNCWLAGYSSYTNGTAGAGTTARGTTADNQRMCDSGGTVGTGSQSLVMVKFGAAGNVFMQGISFAPAPTTAIKTWNGLAKASVKTINGLAIASVKTVNGLA
jgi:hypothetical protein